MKHSHGSKRNSNLVHSILSLRVDGLSSKSIAERLHLTPQQVNDALDVLGDFEIPKAGKRKKSGHDLTRADKQRGGAASQATRQKQRQAEKKKLADLIGIEDKAVELGAVSYVLCHGSSKEFNVTIPNPHVGLVYLRALSHLGVPKEAIHMVWRNRPNSDVEANRIRSQWDQLGASFSFSNSEAINSMRLRVSGFRAERPTGQVSSRGLAQAFLDAGIRVFSDAVR